MLSVNGTDANSKDTTAFIYKYMSHLNSNTKKSLFEHLLDITNTRLIDVTKQNDLMVLLNDLQKLIHETKSL